MGLAGAHVRSACAPSAAHVAHGDPVAARHRNQHGADESRLGERRRALDGDAARAVRALAAAGSAAATSRQASKRRTPSLSGREAAPVKAGTSSLAPWPRACATTCRTPCGRSRRSGSRFGRHPSGGAAVVPEGAARPCRHPRVPALPPERRHAGGRPPADGLASLVTATAAPASTSAGLGNSDGIIEDEYSEQELVDALEVIAGWPRRSGAMARPAWSAPRGAASTACSSPRLAPPDLRRGRQLLRERRPLRRRRALPRRVVLRWTWPSGVDAELPGRPAAGSLGGRRRLARAVARAARAIPASSSPGSRTSA